jgi:hypothetical protein
MERVIIQDCGCIALPESIATALDLRRGMTLDMVLTATGDAILLTPHRGSQAPGDDASSQIVPASSCVILPPSR